MKLKGAPTWAPSLLLIVTVLTCEVSPANILLYHNVASYSHRIASYPLASALADKGHSVTIISPHPIRPHTVEVNPKIKEIVPKQVEETMGAFLKNDLDINLRVKKLLPLCVHTFYPVASIACESLLASKELKDFVASTKKLDLIIMDSVMGECLATLAHIYNAKLITFGPVMTIPNEYDQYGFSPESSSIPEVELTPEKVPMGLVSRIRNVFLTLRWRYEHYKYMSQIDGYARAHLSGRLEGMPHLDDVARNISLFLSSGDVVTDYPRSAPPLYVNVAGLHCRAGKPVPKELDDFVKEGDGFVLISLGSLVVSSNLPEEIKQVFFSTVESFPKLRFLWKWDGELPKSYPKNLHLAKWYPQQDLLAHPKIKAFVSQNGRPSTLEAVYHGVPMVSFPTIGDQDFNANRLNENGANVILELGTVTKEQLREAILRTVYDTRMKTRMLELQKIFKDQPSPPVEKAVWWVEYVLRHKDTTHLRPLGFNLWWFQRRLLDVWGLLFGGLFIALLLTFKMLATILKVVGSLVGGGNKKESSSRAPSSSSRKKGKKE